LDIVDSKDEIDRSARSGCAKDQYVGWGGRRHGNATPAGETSGAYSAAIVCGLKSMPSAFATPAPYAGSAL
jgi:hypothetical protein